MLRSPHTPSITAHKMHNYPSHNYFSISQLISHDSNFFLAVISHGSYFSSMVHHPVLSDDSSVDILIQSFNFIH